MQVDRVLESALYVDDLAAAERFYWRVLGLEAFSREEGRHVFFRCGSAVVLLFNPDQTIKPNNAIAPTHGSHGAGHLAFAVEEGEINDWREHLRRQGVPIEKEVDWPGGGHSIYFRDPAGNSLELATPSLWGI
jgi:catechol 2,3-dioxygenase-like lactoylglutathione lyase family enzyme